MSKSTIDLRILKVVKKDFGRVSVIALGDLFQLQPVMDAYTFKELDNSQYSILPPNLWQEQCLSSMKL